MNDRQVVAYSNDGMGKEGGGRVSLSRRFNDLGAMDNDLRVLLRLRLKCCQIAKFDPFLSLDCARVEGVGHRKGSIKCCHLATLEAEAEEQSQVIVHRSEIVEPTAE